MATFDEYQSKFTGAEIDAAVAAVLLNYIKDLKIGTVTTLDEGLTEVKAEIVTDPDNPRNRLLNLGFPPVIEEQNVLLRAEIEKIGELLDAINKEVIE